jgi:hypothetical protein
LQLLAIVMVVIVIKHLGALRAGFIYMNRPSVSCSSYSSMPS